MFKVRKAQLKDLDDLIDSWERFMKIHNQIVHEANSQFKEDVVLKKNAPEIFRRYLKKSIRSHDSEVFIAEDKAKLAGFIIVNIRDYIPVYEMDKLGYIDVLFVEEEFQEKGLGSKLKDKAMEWFKEKNLRKTYLLVDIANKKAHRIYKKWGFLDYHVEMRKKV